MDLLDFLTSEEEGQYEQSDGPQHTISTDVQKPSKTKIIKKKYEPIYDGAKMVKYEDDPDEYRRARKKVQNRQSAARVRGKKKNAFENLGQQVTNLRSVNSQLLLRNAKLQTQNNSLKRQNEFLKSLIQKNPKNESIDQYFGQIPSTQGTQTIMNQQMPSPQFQSPFEQDSSWFRVPSQKSFNSNSWFSLTIFTIIVAVFVIPQSQTNAPSAAFQTSSEQKLLVYSSIYEFIKGGLKLTIIGLYLAFLGSLVYWKFFSKKMKKI